MKRVVMVVVMVIMSLVGRTQLNLSSDISFSGTFVNAKMLYPIKEQFLIGGSFGYNVIQYNVHERMDLTFAYMMDERIGFELDLGLIRWNKINKWQSSYYRSLPYNQKRNFGNKKLAFHADLGVKMFPVENVYYTLQVSYPGFVKFGVGIKFDIFKKH